MRSGKQRYNLLFIDSGFGYGGSAVFLYNFLCKLNKEKFNPLVAFYYPTEERGAENIEDLGAEVINLGMKVEANYSSATSVPQPHKRPFMLTAVRSYLTTMKSFFRQDFPAAFNLARFIRKKNIKVVFLNNDLQYHVPGVLAAKLAGVRCVCRKAGIGGGQKIKKILGRLVDVFWAISEAAARDQIQMKVPTKRLVLFYGGIDIEKCDPSKTGREIRKEFNLSENRPIIGSISRQEEGHGPAELIQAAGLVVKEFPQAIFLIVGDDLEFGGVLLERLKQKAVGLGVTENIIFVGWRTDIINILAAVDVFVHCPNRLAEGLGMATIEAMAMGKPTIVSDNFGLRETTEDKVTGFVVPKGDTLALSRAILMLLRDGELASDMGRKARLRAEKLFDIRKNVQQIEKLFLELLN